MCIHCETGEDGDCQCDEIDKLKAEIERLRESLSIYVHAHRTDNAVPPHIEAAAVKLLGSGNKAAGVEVSDE